jgi:SAM-dependent methyltransferase
LNRRRFLSVLPLPLAACVSARPGGESAILPAHEARPPDVPFVVSESKVVDAMLQLAEVGAADKVYDLGCGDGRIVIAAAQKYGARGVGIDLDPQLIVVARGYSDRARVSDRTLFLVGDIFDTDLRDASVVTLYLSVKVNRRLRPKLLNELKPGSRIVSNTFDMGDDWAPERTVSLGKTRIFLWRVPA